jgi:hypothetical protein
LLAKPLHGALRHTAFVLQGEEWRASRGHRALNPQDLGALEFWKKVAKSTWAAARPTFPA